MKRGRWAGAALSEALHIIIIIPLRRVPRRTRSSGMRRTGIAHENRLLLHNVIPLAVCLTWVDGVLKIEAAAGGVALDDLVAHGG